MSNDPIFRAEETVRHALMHSSQQQVLLGQAAKMLRDASHERRREVNVLNAALLYADAHDRVLASPSNKALLAELNEIMNRMLAAARRYRDEVNEDGTKDQDEVSPQDGVPVP